MDSETRLIFCLNVRPQITPHNHKLETKFNFKSAKRYIHELTVIQCTFIPCVITICIRGRYSSNLDGKNTLNVKRSKFKSGPPLTKLNICVQITITKRQLFQKERRCIPHIWRIDISEWKYVKLSVRSQMKTRVADWVLSLFIQFETPTSLLFL